MPQLTAQLVTYLTRANAALDDRTTRAELLDRYPHLGDYCAECGSTVTTPNDAEHVIYSADDGSDGHELIIVIGCEGYWTVNPRELSMDGHDSWEAP